MIYDLITDGDTFCVCSGGKGGKGNPHFKSARIQTPRKCTTGKRGSLLSVKLELKLIAEVGFVGYPNAGKSTLLHTLTHANPKIANYPFTTLYPNLGILKKYDHEIVMADIPGIIEGASKGIGLGNEFLRHISRTNTLLFLIEPNTEDIEQTITPFQHLQTELNNYSPAILNEKNWVAVLNKSDLLTDNQIQDIHQLFLDHQVDILIISCFSRKGIEELEQRIIENVKKTNCY